MNTSEIEKLKPHIVVEIIEYIPNAVVSKTIIRRATGNITVSSIDAGEVMGTVISAFDIFIQIVDGAAEVIINGKKSSLKTGDGMRIPANHPHSFNASEQFKMISTTIKSGYEDLHL